MNLYNAIVLLIVAVWASFSTLHPVVSPVSFDNRVHKVDYEVPSGLNAIHFDTDGTSAFIVSEDLFTLLKYDLNTGNLLGSVGGEGEGPGEFSDKILRINIIDRHVYVFSRRTVHIFDKDLRYIDRHVTKYMMMGESYTMVQGGTTSEHVMRSVAIIEHGTWRVHYDVLPADCGNNRLVGNRLICMVSHEQSRYFAVYEL